MTGVSESSGWKWWAGTPFACLVALHIPIISVFVEKWVFGTQIAYIWFMERGILQELLRVYQITMFWYYKDAR